MESGRKLPGEGLELRDTVINFFNVGTQRNNLLASKTGTKGLQVR